MKHVHPSHRHGRVPLARSSATLAPTRGASFPEWLQPVVAEARGMDLPYEPVFLDTSIGGSLLLAALTRLGADIRYAETRTAWHSRSPRRPAPYEVLPALRREKPDAEVADFTGVFRFELDGVAWVAGRVLRQEGMRACQTTVLGGPSLAAVLELEGRIQDVKADLLSGQLHVFGNQLALQGPPEVSEDELILPAALKQALLALVDGFAREARAPDPDGRPRSRGLLMMGRPGTGKTLSIGHVLGRLEECRRYLYVPAGARDLEPPGRRFPDLLEDLMAQPRPAVVVVEDIDRLFAAGAVTPQYFLNVLDGLLRPGAPTLWIATCNDPSELPENLTDRPGRFDRILVFEDPGAEEREELLRLYARVPLPDKAIAAIARDANGLTGAHIAEACRAAGDGGAGEGDAAGYVGRLAAEVAGLRRQQGAAARYGRSIRGDAVGF